MCYINLHFTYLLTYLLTYESNHAALTIRLFLRICLYRVNVKTAHRCNCALNLISVMLFYAVTRFVELSKFLDYDAMMSCIVISCISPVLAWKP